MSKTVGHPTNCNDEKCSQRSSGDEENKSETSEDIRKQA